MEVTLAVRTGGVEGETGTKEQPGDRYAAGVPARPWLGLISTLEQAAILRKPVKPVCHCSHPLPPASGVHALGTTQTHRCSSSIPLSLFFKDWADPCLEEKISQCYEPQSLLRWVLHSQLVPVISLLCYALQASLTLSQEVVESGDPASWGLRLDGLTSCLFPVISRYQTPRNASEDRLRSRLSPRLLFHCVAWDIDGETVETVSDFNFLGSKITADGDCSHEIKRCLLLGKKVMTNLDNILKTRDVTLLTKVRLVKAMVFPVVMYGCESWIVEKAEC